MNSLKFFVQVLKIHSIYYTFETSQVELAIFQVLNRYMWLGATLLDRVGLVSQGKITMLF